MKVAYLDCFSGISGDMLLGGLVDLGVELKYLKKELNKLGLDNFIVDAKRVMEKGISAVKFYVVVKSDFNERTIEDINKIIDDSKLDNVVKDRIKRIYYQLAVSEAKIHNKKVDEIHFHEIGAVDAIVDIAGAVIGLEKLGVKKIYSSGLNVGKGYVKFSHGKYPIPTPATADLLKGVPIYTNNEEEELVTPTGAAIVKSVVSEFCEIPWMVVEKIGYGAGNHDLEQPNLLRIYLGDVSKKADSDIVKVIEATIDDMNPEVYSYVIDKLVRNGAIDAYVNSVYMKKGRQGVLLTVLCRFKDVKRLSNIIFNETTTIGIREYQVKRTKLKRDFKKLRTKYGVVNLKISMLDGEVKNIKPEIEDCKRLARKRNVPLREVYREVERMLG
tara:strand:- start:37234 stop:38391 length:1158 start_codon:yes stop_codon:yes gene_type:complete